MKKTILSVEATRELDERAASEFGIPPLLLMEAAGRGLADHISEMSGSAFASPPILFFCGGGNNGGDGFVAARHLHRLGKNVEIVLTSDPSNFKNEAALNYRIIRLLGISVVLFDPNALKRPKWGGKKHIIVDALLGTGFKPPLRPPIDIVIQGINTLKKQDLENTHVVAVDIPSGLNGDHGPMGGDIVQADTTISFACLKPGLVKKESKKYVGEIKLVDIGIPLELLERVENLKR